MSRAPGKHIDVAARLMSEFAARTGLVRAIEHPRRYLWTDAFAVCNFLELSARTGEQKYRDYHRHASVEGALAHFSSSMGIDLSRYAADEPIRYEKTDAMNSAVESITRLSVEPWTVRRIIDRMGLGSRIPPIVGSAAEVADELIGWVEKTDIDGFNLSRIVTPESLEDFIDLVVPILQERGVYKRDYRPGTLREKLFGYARLPSRHPAAACRNLS